MNQKKLVISTGSEPVSLPGVNFDEKVIVSSTGALISTICTKKNGSCWRWIHRIRNGISVVKTWVQRFMLLNFLDHITPGMDNEISTEFMKILKKQGIIFHMQTKVESIKKNKNGVTILTSDKNGKKVNFQSDIVLIAVGRKPNTKSLNLESIGISLDDKKRIMTNKNFQTNVNNIYAIGDVIEGPMLAHKAEEEGIAVAEIIAGQSGHVNYDIIPSVVYTSPEVASVGKTEEQLKKLNQKYKIGKFPFMANSRAKTIDESEGFVKIIAEEKTDKVLGAHIIGSHAGEMIAEIAVAMEFSASSEDIARTCHAHPTFSEALKEAALSVDKRAIHS